MVLGRMKRRIRRMGMEVRVLVDLYGVIVFGI
jgi:hypothetical protein